MKKEKKKFYQKALILFFILMAVCTLVSRAADSMTIPWVRVQTPQQGRISSHLKGRGVIEAAERKTFLLPAGGLVEECVPSGTNVEPGDVLIQFQIQQLEQRKQELEMDLTKLKLQLEQGESGLVPNARVPEQDSAQRALAAAQSDYDTAAAACQQAANEYNQKLAQLDQEKKSKETQAEQEKDQTKRHQLQQEAEDTYEQKKSVLDGELEAAEAVQSQAQANLEQSRQNLETAQKNDSVTQQNEEKARKEAGYAVEGIRIEVESVQKKLDEVNALLDREGKFCAEEAGTFLDAGITAGMVTTGNEFVSIGTGRFEFLAEIPEKEQEKVAAGDTIELKIQGKEKLEGTVTQVFYREKEAKEEVPTVTVKAELPEGSYTSGMQASFSITKESGEEYQNLLPLTAIRQDSKGYYCLGIRKKDSVLGEEIVAEHIDLTLLDKDDSVAAVNGPLQPDTEIIIGSKKDVEAGNRVRVEE